MLIASSFVYTYESLSKFLFTVNTFITIHLLDQERPIERTTSLSISLTLLTTSINDLFSLPPTFLIKIHPYPQTTFILGPASSVSVYQREKRTKNRSGIMKAGTKSAQQQAPPLQSTTHPITSYRPPADNPSTSQPQECSLTASAVHRKGIIMQKSGYLNEDIIIVAQPDHSKLLPDSHPTPDNPRTK